MTSFRPCRSQYGIRSGTRAIVPSSFMISQTTPAGFRPARRARSTAASVWPARCEHAAVPRAQREDVAGLDEVVRRSTRVDRDLDRVRAVGGGDAGRDALARLDRDGEGGAERRLVALGHRRQAELVAALLGQAEADQPARVRGHEVDRLGRRELGGDHEVALVLAVGIVDDDDDLARCGCPRSPPRSVANGVDRLGRAHGRPYAADEPLDVLREHVDLEVDLVAGLEARRGSSPRACAGSSATAKPSSSSAATVSETPSTAIEPFSTQ